MKKNTTFFYNTTNQLSKWGLITLITVFFFSLQPAPAVHAAGITVSSGSGDNLTAGDDICTLREAITNANLPAGGDSTSGDCDPGSIGIDTITIPAGTYTLELTGGGEAYNDNDNAINDLDITNDIKINGDATNTTTINGGGIDRVIHTGGTSIVTINDLTITGGEIGTLGQLSSSGSFGGGIYRQSSGNMTLTGVTISNNLAGHRGGGLENGNVAGILTLTNCIVSGNESDWGGGIVSGDLNTTTIINNSTFSDNTAHGNGGGNGGGLNIYNGTMTVNNSTFTGNHGPGDGAGMANQDTLIVNNSTITGNATAGNGGGIYTYGGTTTISNTTIANNMTGNGLYNGGGSITVANSIVSDNGTDNCNIAVTDGGNNLEYPGVTCGGFTVQANPLLGALADNGGDTQTRALGVGSPAIDAGNNGTCESADQRGMSRSVDGDGDTTATCDIGAYEGGEKQCSIGVGTYTFTTQSSVQIEITTHDASLACLYVEERQTNHPEATSGGSGAGIATGKYWVIHGLQVNDTLASGYTLNLTIPHSITPDGNAKICKYPGSNDGYGWDCFRTSSTITTVTLNGITSLSEWAAGEGVGPTAVSLQSITTTSQPTGWIAPLFSVLMLTIGSVWLRRVKR